MVHDERGAVERELVLRADTVGGGEVHGVADRVSVHRPPPHVGGVVVGLVADLTADRGRVQQHVGTEQRHRASGLGEPLVPADPDPDRAVPRRPGAKAGVAGVEIELLLVPRTIGDVRLSIGAEHLTVFDDGHRVVVRLSGALEEGHRDDGAAAGGHLADCDDARVFVDRRRPREQLLPLRLAEVRPREELLREDDVRSGLERGVDEVRHLGDVLGMVGSTRLLDHREDRTRAH